MLNIGRDNSDPTYRYKMPKLVTKIEGRGNGIKTVIVNMHDVAKALHVDPAYSTKYFGLELGAQSKYTADTERAVVNGAHTPQTLAQHLDTFIAKFVLCPNCKLPEIAWDVRSSQIKINCAACGHNSVIPPAHRLVSYILKHPPDSKKKNGDDDKDKKKKKEKKKDKKKDKKEEGEGDEGDEEEKELKPKKEKKDKKDKEKKKKDKKKKSEEEEVEEEEEEEESPKKPQGVEEEPEESEDEWFTDTSQAAQEERKKAEFAEMQAGEKPIVQGLEELNLDNPVSLLKFFINEKSRSVPEIVSEVKRLGLARGLDESKRLGVLLEALFGDLEGAAMVAAVKKNAVLLKQFAADRMAARNLLGAFEVLVGVTMTRLLPRTPMILQTLYDTDVLTEEEIINWADAPAEASWQVSKEVAASVREKAEPFVEWLKNADEDDEDDE